jgi:osmotically-inducible protein OsmY
MRGGFGGEGYSNYGQIYGRGAQGRGAGATGYFGDYGSHRDGTPRRWGSEGEEDYDRGVMSARERGSEGGGTRFSKETADHRSDMGGFRGRGPKGYARSDDRISEDVCERLLEDPDVDASEIDVRVENGEVTLSGTVPNRADRRRAEDLVDAVRGVRHVQNNLRVQAHGASGGLGTPEGIRTSGESGIAGTQLGTGGGGTVGAAGRKA